VVKTEVFTTYLYYLSLLVDHGRWRCARRFEALFKTTKEVHPYLTLLLVLRHRFPGHEAELARLAGCIDQVEELPPLAQWVNLALSADSLETFLQRMEDAPAQGSGVAHSPLPTPHSLLPIDRAAPAHPENPKILGILLGHGRTAPF
jgi:hypothetical protein